MSTTKDRTTFTISKHIRLAFAIYAIRGHKSMSAIVEDLITDYLRKEGVPV